MRNWNRKTLLDKCLQSYAATIDSPFQLIVIDNASSGVVPTEVRELKLPHLRFKHPCNSWSQIKKMRDRIFFFHNPKAGGSSLRLVLESRFPAANRSPLIENNMVDHEELHGDYARFRGYDLYAGHYGRDIFSAVNDGHRYVTNFRHPVTRLISLYNFFRFNVKLSDDELHTDRYYAVRLAKSIDFKSFISADDPRVEVYVRNSHFRQLANSCWSLKTTRSLSNVCRFVDRMPWYYVCEFPEISVFWFWRVFNCILDEMPRSNLTGNHGGQATSLATLDHSTCQIIYRKNELDFALYRHAVDRLVNRSFLPASLPVSPAKIRNLLQSFKALRVMRSR
jgi:glycosyltransferase involved in cell wall biosynthesis